MKHSIAGIAVCTINQIKQEKLQIMCYLLSYQQNVSRHNHYNVMWV